MSKMRNREVKATKPGMCKVCGCTEEHACEQGCSWVDGTETMCSACIEWVSRATAKGAKHPALIPVYGLWITDGGPRSKGHWLIECFDGNTHVPAVFFDMQSALKAAKREIDEGLDVKVVVLRAERWARQ